MDLFFYINEKFVVVLKNRISELVNSVYFDLVIKFISVDDKKINNPRIKVTHTSVCVHLVALVLF